MMTHSRPDTQQRVSHAGVAQAMDELEAREQEREWTGEEAKAYWEEQQAYWREYEVWKTNELPKLAQQVGVDPRPWVKPLSSVGKALLIAVAAHNVSVLPQEPAHRRDQVDSVRVETDRPFVERIASHEARIRVSGFEAIHLNSARHAEGLGRVMRPFLQSGSYNLSFSSEQRYITAAYFGLYGSQHNTERYAILGECSHPLVGSEDQMTVYAASVWEEREGTQARGIDRLIDTEIHELGHARNEAELKYFADRVKSDSRIKFPYPELFLRARVEGKSVLWEAMANEYRSELIRVLLRISEIPAGQTIEDAAVPYIRDRFPGSSEDAIREDVRMIIQFSPTVNWNVLVKQNWAFRREQTISYERGLLIHRFIRPIQDPVVREVLMDVLDRRASTRVMRLRNMDAFSSATEAGRGVNLVVQELNQYGKALSDANDQLLTTVRSAQGRSLDSRLASQWQDLVRAMHTLAQYRLKMMDSSPQRDRDGRPFSDADWVRRMSNETAGHAQNYFAALYNPLSEEDRAKLYEWLRESAQLNSGGFELPGELAVRAEPYLERRRSVVIPLNQ